MSLAEGMKDIAENIVASYETRSRSIGSLFDTTHQILEGFQNSFFDTRHKRESRSMPSCGRISLKMNLSEEKISII